MTSTKGWTFDLKPPPPPARPSPHAGGAAETTGKCSHAARICVCTANIVLDAKVQTRYSSHRNHQKLKIHMTHVLDDLLQFEQML